MTLDNIKQRQLDLGAAGFFRPEAEDPAGNQIVVKAGFLYSGAYSIEDQGDQTTAGFASVASGAGFKRYDLVYADETGAVQILQGNDVPSGDPDYSGAPGRSNGPDLPDQVIPVAYVLVDEIGAVTVDESDITQITGFLQTERDLDGYFVDYGFFGSAPAGSSDDVSALFAGKTFGGSSTVRGVITSAPLNYVHLVNQNYDEIIHTATGSRVYGRVTEAAGVVTLSYYYTDASGVEQPVTDISTDTTSAPTDLRLVGVPEVFSRNDPTRPLFDSAVVRQSDQLVGDIPLATESSPGKVQLAADLDTAANEAVQGNDQRVNTPVQAEDSGGAAVGGRYSHLREGTSITLNDLGGGRLEISSASAPTPAEWERVGSDSFSGTVGANDGSASWHTVMSVTFSALANEVVFVSIMGMFAEDAGVRLAVDGSDAQWDGQTIGNLGSIADADIFFNRDFSTFVGPLSSGNRTIAVQIRDDSATRGGNARAATRPVGGSAKMIVSARR